MDASPSCVSTSAADAEREARRDVGPPQGFATALLVLMAALTLASYALPPGFATAVLQAAAKAGFVGGIADWFAVTALFRHPLGIPIPHTAIIPAQKARLGPRARPLRRQPTCSPLPRSRRSSRGSTSPGILAPLPRRPAATRPAARGAGGACCRGCWPRVEDGRARRLLARLVPRVLGGAGAGRMRGAARCTNWSRAAGTRRCSASSSTALRKCCSPSARRALRRAIEERVREQGGRLVGWALGASIARRVLAQVNAELDKMEAGGSDLRAAFDEWMRREIVRIEEDPERAAEIGRAIRRVLRTSDGAGLGPRRVVAACAWRWRPTPRDRTGRTVAVLEGGFANLGTMLATDPGGAGARAGSGGGRGGKPAAVSAGEGRRIHRQGRGGTGTRRRSPKSWNCASGRDLQYVRINGTLVGFLVGGVLYALLRAAFGPVAF